MNRKIIKPITRLIITTFIITNILSAFPSVSFGAPRHKPKTVESNRDKSEIIVVYKDDTKADALNTTIKGKLKLKKLNVKKKFKKNKIDLIEIDKGDDVKKVVAELKKDKNVKYAQPNYKLQISSLPSDPQFSKQWGLQNNGQSVEGLTGRSNADINAVNAWNLTQGSPDVVIGLLDSGVDTTHEDLKDNLVPGWDFVNNDDTVYDSPELDLHGTEVAGIIAAEANSTGITGVAPKVKIMPLKFMSGTTGYTSDAIAAIQYAMDKGIKIINCSFAGSDNNQALKDTMQNSGILFICSAGNRGADTANVPVYPACFNLPNIISVAALDSKGVLSNFTSYGQNITVAAPGVNILTTTPNNTYDYLSGTSASAPFVTGEAALLKSCLPGLTTAQIAERIKQNTVTCTNLAGKLETEGRADAYAALANVKPAPDTYTGPGNDVDTAPPGQDGGDIDTWYGQDQLAKITARLHYGESGVNPGSGSFSFTVNDMSVPAPGFTVNISRTYNSSDDKAAPFGRGWTFGFEGSAKGSDLVTVILPTGAVQRFRQVSGNSYSAVDSRSKLEKTDGIYILTTKDQYTYTFDANGWLSKMTDRNGSTVEITVDPAGKVSKIKDTAGREYNVSYNTGGLIQAISDVQGRTVNYEYDENNRLTAVTDPMGGKMHYAYDGFGYLNKITDNNSKEIESLVYCHSEGANQGRVTEAKDANGDDVYYTYDTVNMKTTATDKNQRKSIYWFDQDMYTIKVQDPDGKCTITEYYYYNGKNTFGDIISTTDRNGNTTKYNIDDRGNVIKKINFADNSTIEYAYDDKNNMTSEKDGSGNHTYYKYDTNNNLVKKIQPLNGTDAYEETSNQSDYAITCYDYYSKDEAQSLFECGAGGLLRSVKDPENNVTTYTYDKYGNTKTVTDPENNTTTYEYNNIGWKTAETSPKGTRTEFTYDKNGQLIKTTIANGNGETIRTVYDTLGRKIQEISPNQYNAGFDNLEADTYSDSNAGTRYEYYDSGLLKQKTDAEGNITSYTYDEYGNTLTETKPNGSIYRYEYDIMDRPVKTYWKESSTAAETLLSENAYEILGNGKTQKTETRYLNSTDKAVTVTITDYAGRAVEQQNPDGTKLKTAYNPTGTISSSTAANGSTVQYKYDSLNRLTEQWTPFEISNGNTLYTYTKTEYDRAGNKTAEKAGTDKVSLYGIPRSLIVKNYEYYKNGKLKKVTDSDGRRTDYAYDADGNATKEEQYIDSVNKKTTEYDYNYLNKAAHKTLHVKAGDIYTNDPGNTADTALTTEYTYDADGNVKTVKDPRGTVTTYTYDSLNRQLSVSQPGVDENNDPTTITTSTTYCSDEEKPLTTTDAKGNITNYEYNKRGLVTKVIDAKGGITAYAYDLAGRKITEVSPKNYDSSKTSLSDMSRIEYIYDSMNRVKAKKDIYLDPAANTFVTIYTKAYEYDNSGNTIKELDAKGYQDAAGTLDEKISEGKGTETVYNLANKPVTVLDAVSKERGLPYTTKNDYDALGRKTAQTNAKGVVTLYEYDNAGNILNIKVKKSQNTAAQTIQTDTYDLAGRKKTEKDGNGSTTAYEYNAFDKEASIAYPGDTTIDAKTVTCQYDENGELKTQKDSTGKTDTYVYDNQGRVLSHTQNEITTSVRYDKNGNKRYETDGNGIISEKTYDSLDRLETTKISTICMTQTTTYEYDANGNQTAVTDWKGNKTTSIYDPLNRLIEKHDPYTTIQKLSYTVNSLQYQSTDALGNITEYAYDSNGRLISTKDPEGHITKQAYDNAGNIQSKTDGNGLVTTYAYDEFNKLKSVTNPKGEATSYTYDLNGNMLTQTDGNGNTTAYRYNAGDKLSRKTDPSGKTESYTYYADGSMKTRTDRNGKTTSYTYDVYGRLLNRTNGAAAVSYTYDNNGNQLTMTDSTGTTVRTYDGIGRVMTKIVPKIGTSIYEYDRTDGLTAGYSEEKTTDPKGNITLKVYDKAGRLVTVTSEGKTTEYAYYDNGSRKSVTYPNGAKEEYSYYKNGLNNTLANTKKDGTIIDSYIYTYDAAHNMKTKSDKKGLTVYTYDSLNRLFTVTEPNGRLTSYTYDKAGNRLSETVTSGTEAQTTTYTYNEQNRLVKTITQNQNQTERMLYAYDGNGNITSKNKTVVKSKPSGSKASVTGSKTGEGADSTQSLYSYDEWNQMVKAAEGRTTSTYEYNGEGYRVQKTVNGQITRYLYEADKVVLETDGSGNQTAANVYGTNLLKRNTEGDTLYYMYNGHGDVTALINDSQELMTNGSFDTTGFGWNIRSAQSAFAIGERDTTDYFSAPAGFKITCIVGGSQPEDIQLFTMPSNYVRITAGKQYKLTFRAKSDGGDVTPVISLMKHLSPGTAYDTPKEVTISGTWETYTVTFTASTSDDAARITFYLGGMAAGATLHIDAVSFKEATETSGEVKQTYYYDAFGNITEQSGEVDNSITYAGYQYDKETGLYYLNSRMYDPKVARFLQEDTFKGFINDPLSLNLYIYCFNNPIMYVDPTGHFGSSEAARLTATLLGANLSTPKNQSDLIKISGIYESYGLSYTQSYSNVLIGNTNIGSTQTNNGITTGNINDVAVGLNSKVSTQNGITSLTVLNQSTQKTQTITYNKNKLNNGWGTASDGSTFRVINGVVQVDINKVGNEAGYNDSNLFANNYGGFKNIIFNPKGVVVADTASGNTLLNSVNKLTGSSGFSIDKYGMLRYDNSKDSNDFTPLSNTAMAVFTTATTLDKNWIEFKITNDKDKGHNLPKPFFIDTPTYSSELGERYSIITIDPSEYPKGITLCEGIGKDRGNIMSPIELSIAHEFVHALRWNLGKTTDSEQNPPNYGKRDNQGTPSEAWSIYVENTIAMEMQNSSISQEQKNIYSNAIRYDGDPHFLTGSLGWYGMFNGYDYGTIPTQEDLATYIKSKFPKK